MFDSYFDVGHGILITYITYILKTMVEARFFQNLFKLELLFLTVVFNQPDLTIEKIEAWDKQFTHFPQFSENG